ncbi:MAG TPA: TlpA disulfide reductase family protein [Candidatus Dormibacteraeota bacterium]|nr:TlpA disulfide reductase family protein [Candidatus Dormibacteraeota bacterium]
MSRWRRGALLTLVLSIIAVTAVLGYRHFEATGGQSATTIQLARLDGSGSSRLADWHGTPLVVNLFASWCPSCLTEMPAFERVSHDYAGRVVIVGVDSQDSPDAGLKLARQLGITYPLLSDSNHADLYALLDGQGMPVTAFIRRDGTVMRVYRGELDEALLRQLIDQLIQR